MPSAKLHPDKVRELVLKIEAWQDLVRARGSGEHIHIGESHIDELTPAERAALEARGTGPLPIEEKH